MNNFSGYILAGGKSSRMGADKAFLKIGEKTFLENSVEILKPVCEQIKIVLNRSQNHFIEKIPEGVSHIFDRFENRGALGGIHAAFSDCKTEYAVILAVDLPFVTSEAIEKLCEIILNKKDFSAVVPRQTDGKLQPLAAVYRVKECLNLEKKMSENASIAVRDFLNTIETKIIETGNLDANEILFINVNSPDDLQKFKDKIQLKSR